MSFTVKLDQARFSRGVKDLMKLTNRTMEDVLREQGGLFCKDAMRFTPPFKDQPIKEAWKVQERAGQAAIMTDILGGGTLAWTSKPRVGVFVVLTNEMKANAEKRFTVYESRTKKGRKTKVRGAAEILVHATKDGKLLGVDFEHWRVKATLGEMLDHLARFRSRRTGRVTTAGARTRDVGRWKFIEKWVITQTQFNKLKKHLFGLIGLAKSGWVKPFMRLKSGSGGKANEGLPTWITRHARGISSGIYSRKGTGNKVKFIVGNAIPYVQRFAGHIEQRAWRNRLRNFPKQVEQTAKALARKAAREARA